MESTEPSGTLAADQADSVKVSIVVPTYQEVENIEELVERVSDTFDQLDEMIEIIVVDDASRDGTDQKIADLRKKGRNVRMIERLDERGLSSAVLRGFDESKGEYLVCMDADLSHPPEKLPELVRALQSENAEMVVGSRYVRGATTDENWGFFRLLNSRIATLLARPFTGIKDPMAGFFAIPREVYQRTRDWDPIGYKIGLEILVKADCRRVEEVPIHFADRRHGESKLSLAEQLNYIRHLGRLGRHKYARTCNVTKFAIVGATGTVVDLVCFAMLLSSGFGIAASRALAIGVAMTWNFSGNDRWTFRSERKGMLGRFQKYAVSCSFGAAASFLVTVLGARWFPPLAAYPMLLAMTGIGVGTIVNYVLARHWVFTTVSRKS